MTTLADTEHRLVEIVYPSDANSMGTLFGGRALWLMDRLAFIVASRYSRLAIVTAASEKVEFRAPVKVGDLIELTGRIVHVGRTSLRVGIEMHAENLISGNRFLCTTGEFVMVALDADGSPAIVPQLPDA